MVVSRGGTPVFFNESGEAYAEFDQEKQNEFIMHLVSGGMRVRPILKKIGVSFKAYLFKLTNDDDFKLHVKQARALRAEVMHDDFAAEELTLAAQKNIFEMDQKELNLHEQQLEVLQKKQTVLSKQKREDSAKFSEKAGKGEIIIKNDLDLEVLENAKKFFKAEPSNIPGELANDAVAEFREIVAKEKIDVPTDKARRGGRLRRTSAPVPEERDPSF